MRKTKRIGCYFGNSQRLKDLAAENGRRYLKNLTVRDSELVPHNAS